MHLQLSQLLQKLKSHQYLHKISIFNKQKNNLNMHQHNITQGKLISILKQYKYFYNLHEMYGTEYLIEIVKADKVFLINSNANANGKNKNVQINQKNNTNNKNGINNMSEFLLIDGIFRVYQIKKVQKQIKQKNNKKDKYQLQFQKYISSQSLISFNQYKQGQFQLISHQDCFMLKLPNKTILDPSKFNNKLPQAHFHIQNKQLYIQQLSSTIQHIKSLHHKKHVQFDPRFALGNFDYNQLLLHSKIRHKNAKQSILKQGAQITSIGLILKGKILQKDIKKSKKLQTIKQAMITFYKKDYKSESKKKQIFGNDLLNQGDWIFIEEYLESIQKYPFRAGSLNHNQERRVKIYASKQIVPIQDCQIMWVPLKIFARKFNYSTNYEILYKWNALIKIKNEVRTKNQELNVQLKKQNQQSKILQIQLPQIIEKVVKLGHNVEQIQQKTDLKTRIFSLKQSKYKKQIKPLNFPQTSLLNVTLNNSFKSNMLSTLFNEDNLQTQKKSFSKYAKQLIKKKHANSEHTKPLNKISSDKKIPFNESTFISNQIQQDLIMFPEQYEHVNLKPNMKRQLLIAERAIKLSSINNDTSKFPKSNSNFLQHSNSNNLPQQNKTLLNNKSESSYQSIINNNLGNYLINHHSLHVSPNSPQKIYKGLAEKISFKFPNLQNRLRQQKEKKKSKIKSIKVKDRIQTLKIIQEISKKKKNSKKTNYQYQAKSFIGGLNLSDGEN